MPPSAPRESVLAVEATAPCRVDLAGGVVAGFAEALRPAAAISVGVALDRRAHCRVLTIPSGVRVESKDTLLKLEVPRVADLPTEGVPGLVRHVLLALGAESGLLVVTQARVPFEAGLGSATALAVAVAAATARARGRTLAAGELPALVHGLPGAASGAAVDALLAAGGGVAGAAIAASQGAAVERLRVDPARIEECLLLVDPASGTPIEAVTDEARVKAALAEIADGALRMRETLAAGRASAVTGLVAAEHEAWVRLGLVARGGPAEDIARLARAAGGAARLCGREARSLVLVWAEPGERRDGPKEAVAAALKAAGYRTFPCRLDLRGLEVEEA